MLFSHLFRRGKTPRAGCATQPRRFVPQLTALEDRSVPSVTAVPFKETLTFIDVTGTGEAHYVGHATHFGTVNAVLYPDHTFVKTAANGDTAVGFVTFFTPTTGTVTITGGTGRFEGATGFSSAVITVDPDTGVQTVNVTGTLTYDHLDPQGGPESAAAAKSKDSQVLPFRVSGEGDAFEGLPVFPGGTAAHNATGTATHLGKYTGEGVFQLLSLDLQTLSGTFQTASPFVFVAANGDRLAFHYGRTDVGADEPGKFDLIPQADGKVVAVFVAEFTPVAAQSTGASRRSPAAASLWSRPPSHPCWDPPTSPYPGWAKDRSSSARSEARAG
jgi:hypothetical protein